MSLEKRQKFKKFVKFLEQLGVDVDAGWLHALKIMLKRKK